MEHSYGPNHSSLFLLTAVMTSDTQRRRTSLNARVARRRILLAFETSWTLPFQLTLESNASNRKRRKPVKRSAKTRRALAEGFQRQKPRKRNVVQRRKPRRRRKLRRSILRRSECSFLTDDLYRLQKQRQRRRRLQLPMPRRRHAAPRELRVAKLRNSGPCHGSCTQDFHFVAIASILSSQRLQ